MALPLTNNSHKKMTRKKKGTPSCGKVRIRTCILIILAMFLVVYGVLWTWLAHSSEKQRLTKEEERLARLERTKERKRQIRQDYKILKTVKAENRARQNRTKYANSSDATIFDFSKQAVLPPNLIRQQIDEQRPQKKSGGGKFKTNTAAAGGQSQQQLQPIVRTQDDRPSLYLNYKLQKNQPYNITYGQFTTCKAGTTTNKWGRKPVQRVPLAPEFAFLQDFTTTVDTNLKILSLGDSVGIQFHQVLEEAAHALPQNRQMLQYAWGEHESVSVAAPIQGGGVLGAFRMTGMFLRQNMGKEPPNAPGGGWLPEHVNRLLQHPYNTTSRVNFFDAMIFRIPHGWLKLDDITKETITESIEIAHEAFGIKTAVVLTLYFNNNVQTERELLQLERTNDMIRDLVKNWDTETTGVQVLLMDFGAWVTQLMHKNAKLAGMDQTYKNYTLERLGCMKKYPPSKAMVCTDVVPADSCTCKRNMISIDGLHWCMESIGGRVVGAMACLLQCPLLEENSGNEAALKQCEQTCNKRFMSLETLEIE